MKILRHELRQGQRALLVWTAVIAFMLGICIVIYPEMESQMDEISGMFSDMGSFSAAFGMDRISFGEFIGFSAFLNRGGAGIGLGITILFYFLNLIANLTEKADFLKYITPFGYTEAADIIVEGRMDTGCLAVGLVCTVVGIGVAFLWYERKDIVA